MKEILERKKVDNQVRIKIQVQIQTFQKVNKHTDHMKKEKKKEIVSKENDKTQGSSKSYRAHREQSY